MNLNLYNTTVYKNKTAFRRVKNKPNSNPNKPNLRKAQMIVNSLITKDYRKKDDFIVRINKPNFRNGQNEHKLNFNKGLQKKRLFRSPKNKPNSNPIFERPKSLAKKSDHTLLWIYLNLFLTPPGQTAKVPPLNLNLLITIKAYAKLRLGIYYLRKSVFLIFLNNHLTDYYTMTYCLKRKNKNRFFSFQSMPNLNFAELIITIKKGVHMEVVTMDCKKFVEEQISKIRQTVGDATAINALSGGVDSSLVTVLGHRALGEQFKTIFVDNALMRQGEPQWVVKTFADMGIPVELVDAREEFLSALAGLTDPEEKRQAVTDTFYAKVFSRLVRESGAKFLLHGTILTDIEETIAGIKRQHNILAQLGINPEEAYGYSVLEPLKTLRKDGVREVCEFLKLPAEISQRIPFPGPALATRIVGEVTRQRLTTVRAATAIVEEELRDSGAFQYMAVLLNDRATGIRDNRREFGQIIVVRCIESTDARTATATKLPWDKLQRICERIINEIDDVNRCLYDLTPKPPATVEYI